MPTLLNLICLQAGNCASSSVTTFGAALFILSRKQNRKGVPQFIREHPNNSVIDIYYNPASPNISVLTPGLGHLTYIWPEMGAIALLLSFPFVCLMWMLDGLKKKVKSE
jgi:hypothetical protein